MDKKNQLVSLESMPVNVPAPLCIAEKAARAGGKVIKERFGQSLAVHWKRGVEAQTLADVEAERVIRELLEAHFPEDTINGEEFGVKTGTSPYTWVIDPLDGTSNFVLDIPQFAVCISLLEYTRVLFTVIYQPIVDVLYVAREESGAFANEARICVSPRQVSLSQSTVCSILTYEAHGQEHTYGIIDKLYRNSHRLLDTWAPALDWCLLATGKIDALIYISDQRMCLDPGMLAGAFFFHTAGGYIGDLEGNLTKDWMQMTSVIASSSSSMIQEVYQVIALQALPGALRQSPFCKPGYINPLHVSADG